MTLPEVIQQAATEFIRDRRPLEAFPRNVMNLDELLDHWRQGEISEAELDELIRQLATPEGRARLRQEWFLDVALPLALHTTALKQTEPAPRLVWDAIGRFALFRWRPVWGWGANFAILAAAAVSLVYLATSWMENPSPPARTAVGLTAPTLGTEDLRDLALLVAEPPVPALHSPQDAWLAVLSAMTEGKKP